MKPQDFNTKIITKRLILKGRRHPTRKMAAAFSNLIQHNLKFFRKWISFAQKKNTPELSYQKCCKSSQLWKDLKEADYNIFLKNGELIGQINMKNINYKTASGEIGYYMGKKYTGKGYMTEAVLALEAEFFKRGIKRIIICTDKNNTASINVARRCGYKLYRTKTDTTKQFKRTTVIYSKQNPNG